MAMSKKPAHSFIAHPMDVALCGDCYHSKGWHVGTICWVCNQGPGKGTS